MPIRLLVPLVVLAVATTNVAAHDSPASGVSQGSNAFATLTNEYEAATKACMAEATAAYQKATKNGTVKFDFKDLKLTTPWPSALYSPRFLAIAEKNPEGPEAIDALKMTIETSAGPEPGSHLDTLGKAVSILRDHYVARPQIQAFLKRLAVCDDDNCTALLNEVIARNPDRKVQLAAHQEQIARCESMVQFEDAMKDAKRRAEFEKTQGNERVHRWFAKAAQSRIELARLKKSLRENYADLYTEVEIGKAAPELKMESLEGSEAKLSALRGKVVVLDIWTTWCGPCNAMIPHEREMVERLKDKPFVLVSISADEKKKTLIDFVAKEKMPWTHWWNGSEGGIISDWQIRYFPTIFVLDKNGVIRHKGLRGDELEKAVNVLIAETPGRPTES